MADGLTELRESELGQPRAGSTRPSSLLFHLSVCLSICLSVVTTETAVWKDDAEVIIRKITHMSRTENRQSVSGIGGKVCVWDLGL